MNRNQVSRLALALPLAFAFHAQAADRDAPQPRYFGGFTEFAGSDANRDSLVQGLRYNQPVTLTERVSPTEVKTTTFDSPTGPMGWGNVRHSLTLARGDLQAAGIRNPTPQQLQAALNGGTVTRADGSTVAFRGVLQMRADGMGWGQIRKDLALPNTGFSQGAPHASSGAGITTALGTPPANAVRSRSAATNAGPGKSGTSTSARASMVSTGAGSAGIVTGAGAAHGNSAFGQAGGNGGGNGHGPK